MEMPALVNPRSLCVNLELHLRHLVRLIVQTLKPVNGGRQAMQNDLSTALLPHCLLYLALQNIFLGQLRLVKLRETVFYPSYKYVKLVCCLSQNYAWRNLVKRHHYKHWQGL